VIRRLLVVPEPGRVEWVDDELADVPDGGLLLRTVATGLSAGTELTFVKGDHPAVRAVLDPELGLFRPVAAAGLYPVRRLGYMEVATVETTRTAAFAEGDLVAAAYGHASAHVADPLRENVVRLPSDVDPVLATYVAHLGPICANGLLHAAADAVGGPVSSLSQGVEGRRVLVTGAGLIGLLVALLAVEHGAAEVVVADSDARRRAVATALGLGTVDAEDADAEPALVLKTRWRHGAGDHGADVVFQCRGRPAALATALRAVRPQGTVVDLAFYTEGADAVMLGEEFHHNGLSLRSAQIGRVPRGLAATWDRARLSHETVRLLQRRGSAIRKHLVTDVVPWDEAPQLMLDVAARRRHVISAVFRA
jgi:threonine dehydrogenase-like Zn-dependent dehydrogenase